MNKILNLFIIFIILIGISGLTNDYTYHPISTRQISNKAIATSNFYSIKDHNEFKGEKQTVLTRCKIS